MPRTHDGVLRTQKYQWRQGQYTYTDEEIFAALREVAQAVEGSLSSQDYSAVAEQNGHVLPSLGLVLDRFNTWNEALAKAGLSTNPSRRKFYTRIEDETLVDALKAVTEALGETPSITRYDDYRRDHDPDLPSSVLIRKRLHGWLNAMYELEKLEKAA